MNCKEKMKQEIRYNNKKYLCSLNFVMEMIGDKYKCMILFHLKNGEMRSGKLQSLIEGISNRMFTYSIRALERDGLVEREVYPEVPPHVVYRLTKEGTSIIPIILDLDNWGKSYAKDHYLYAPAE